MPTNAPERRGDLLPSSVFPAHFDPFNRLRGQIDELFGRYVKPTAFDPDSDMIVALDVAETDRAYEFKFDVPGVRREDIDIDFGQGHLSVSGERRHEATEEKKSYRQSERSFGAFSTSFALPADVDGDKISADLKDGVLTITVPKSDDPRKRAKKIAVKAR